MRGKGNGIFKTGLCFLSIALLISNILACKKEEVDKNLPITATGYEGAFVEKEVVSSEEMNRVLSSPILLDEGSLVFYGMKEADEATVCRFISKDNGDTWTEEELSWDIESEGRPTLISPYPGGSCFMVNYCINDGRLDGEKWWLIKEGEHRELTRPAWAEGKIVNNCQMVTAESVFLCGSEMMEGEGVPENYYKIYNFVTGETIDVKLPEECLIGRMILDSSKPEEPELLYWDTDFVNVINDRGEVKTVQSGWNGNFGSIDKEGNFYFIDSGNIIRIAKNGSLKEEVMEDNGFLLGEAFQPTSAYFYYGMTCLSDGSFLVVLEEKSGSNVVVIKYCFDETIRLTKTDSLTIWTLNDSDMLRAAKNVYEKEHPETEIKVIIGMDENYGTLEDLTRKLKMSLLSGECPDLIILDQLDYGNMAEKGYFIDLAPAVDTDELMPNIISSMTKDGKLYVIPGLFTAPVLIGDDFDEHPINELSDLEEAILTRNPRPSVLPDSDEYFTRLNEEERYGIGFKDEEELVHFIMMTSAPEIIKEDGLNEEALEEVFDFLVSVGKHYDMEHYPEYADRFHMAYNYNGGNMVEIETGEAEYGRCGRAQYGWGEVRTPAYFSLCRRVEGLEDTTGSLKSFPGLCKNPYIPKLVMGVPVNAKNQAQAVELVQLLLSTDIQKKQDMAGNPVNKTALWERIGKNEEFVKKSGFEGDMYSFYEELETPIILDANYGNIELKIRSELYNVLTGKKTKKQAIKSIKKETYLMFEEQK